MLEIIIKIIEWCDLRGPFKKKEIESTPFVPKFRVVRSYGAFYVEKEFTSGTIDSGGNIFFTVDGMVYTCSRWDVNLKFENSEDACALANKLNAGQTYFPEYDIRGYKVIDCACLEKPSE